MAPLRSLLRIFPQTPEEWRAALLTFSAYFLTAYFGIWIFYHFQTSPALLWPPVGIAIVAMWWGGYRMWLPIFIASFIAIVAQRPGTEVTSLIIAIAYALQAVVGLNLMRHFGFSERVTLRNVAILIGIAFGVTIIEPLILTASLELRGMATVSPLVSIGRAWGGGIFSALVITPLLLLWYPWRPVANTALDKLEKGAAFSLLILTTYLLFWTTVPNRLGIVAVFLLPAVLVWFALRFRMRWMALALFTSSLIALAGTLVVHPSTAPIAAQLLADQVYMGFIAAMFLAFAAAVEERRAAFRSLEEAYRMTFESDKAKSEFIAILAHELRNPLAPIVSSLELLKLKLAGQGHNSTLDNALMHAEMIRRLLDDLLDIARLTQKKFKLQKEAVALRDIISESMESVSDFARAKKQRLSVRLPQEDILLHADRVRLKQIIINLLNNACKYTQEGGSIELIAERDATDAVIMVRDNGEGIAPEAMGHLFQPFKQMRPSERGTGLGIGLYITKRITEMHGGTIEVVSEGRHLGSTFTVRIPLPNSLPLPIEKPRHTENAPSKRVLIVDDNQAAADAMQKLLKHLGHKAEVAYSGREALDSVVAFRPDLILLDIGMPEIDGYETARRLREGGWGGKIVALSGCGQEADELRSKHAGVDQHLVTPGGLQDIAALVGRIS